MLHHRLIKRSLHKKNGNLSGGASYKSVNIEKYLIFFLPYLLVSYSESIWFRARYASLGSGDRSESQQRTTKYVITVN
tara:strand:+ start:195 stop:428 length:234 start_codon:yes stop_codon:yes gene_type:complete